MKMLIKLAYRNVFRYKRRTLITFLTISLGLAMLIITVCLIDGADKQGITNLIDSQVSHFKICRKDYFEKKDDLPLNLTIKEPERIHNLLKNVPAVMESESRIIFNGSLIKGMDELPCQGVAIEPGRDMRILNIRRSLIEGTWLEDDESKVLVGKNLAKDIGLAVGDIITLRLITSSGDEDLTWNALDVEIKGIFDSGNPNVDRQYVMMPLGLARSGLGLGAEATEILVRLKTDARNDRTLTKIQGQIEEALKPDTQGLGAFSWKESAALILAVSKEKRRQNALVILITLFIAAMGIINTMLMAVFERTREIGMLAALGLRKAEIKKLFVLEGSIIGIFGSLVGCILGGLGGWYYETYGFRLASMGESGDKIIGAFAPVKDIFYGDLSFEILVSTFLLGVFISIISSFYPASKATRLNPIEALKHI